MYLKCAHPDCTADFDYGQGRFFRFQQFPRQSPPPANSHSVKHYWLCTRCCETYTIEYQTGQGVLLLQRLDTLTHGQPSHFILQDERGANRKLPAHHNRVRRERKRKGELISGQIQTIEVLENRNLEKERLKEMIEEIGVAAGAIWHTLDTKGEMTLAKLKKELKAEGPVFDWAIGWLAREDKIWITREKRTVRVCLMEHHRETANAA